MTIKLYDSMARAKRPFAPLDPDNVRMYVCGPTVYDRAHIGNARPAVVFDVLFRLLRHEYGAEHVTYVRNITDIDDKIIARAHERGVEIDTVTQETARWFQEDMAALGCLELPPGHQPRATEYVAQMVAMIERLIALGCAYAADGHVLFEVAKFPDYGRLSGRSTDDMIAGARVEVAPYKRDPMDFVLWKPSDAEQPGWESPWGRGRPGWHIECSAMARALLGESFDIHGGGADLMFPHHENEIAQSVCAHPGEGFARYWLHNGMVRVEGQKMSKSLGNFFTVQDKLAEGVPGEVIRLALLMTHYRDTLDLSDQRFEEARKTVDQWSRLIAERPGATSSSAIGRTEAHGTVIDALSDDLNTPLALAAIHDLARHAVNSDNEGNEALAEFHLSLMALGLDLKSYGHRRDVEVSVRKALVKVDVEALLTARADARAARDFAKADAIRKALDAAGVVVMDKPGAATEWELAPHFDPAKLEGIEA